METYILTLNVDLIFFLSDTMMFFLKCLVFSPSSGPGQGDLYRFSPRFDRIISGEALNPIFSEQDAGFLKFRST